MSSPCSCCNQLHRDFYKVCPACYKALMEAKIAELGFSRSNLIERLRDYEAKREEEDRS